MTRLEAAKDGAQARAMTRREWAMLLLLALIWAGSFLFGKVAVAEIPPFTLVFGRVGLAALALFAGLPALGVPLPRGVRLWRDLLAMGLFNNVIPFTLIFWGQTQIGAGLASILNATTPLFTVLVAHGWTRDERLTPAMVAGVLLGFAGVALLLGPGLLLARDASVLAEAACLGAALSYAFASVFGRRFARLGVVPAQAAFGQITASALVMAPLCLLLDRPWLLPVPGAAALAALLALGLVCTAFAYLLFFRILAGAGATNIMLVTFLIPPGAVLLGILVLGETPGAGQFAGMALIGLGLAAIDRRGPAALGRGWRRLRPAA